MKLWQDMTPEEKGALLLAHHEGKTIEFFDSREWVKTAPNWLPRYAYRVAPTIENVVMYLGKGFNGWAITEGQTNSDTHKITFRVVNGEPDSASFKVEKL